MGGCLKVDSEDSVGAVLTGDERAERNEKEDSA